MRVEKTHDEVHGRSARERTQRATAGLFSLCEIRSSGVFSRKITSIRSAALVGTALVAAALNLGAATAADRDSIQNAALSQDAASVTAEPLWSAAPAALEALSRQDARPLFLAVRDAAVRGGIDAQHLLGLLYREGIGTEANSLQAGLWLSRAAANGHPLSQLVRCVDGPSLPDRSECEAAAEAGVPRALAILAAGMMERGERIEEARASLETASRQGDSLAHILLGRLHYDGMDAAYDPARAISLWQRAALQGDAEAIRLIGLAHLEGQGVALDANRAFEHFLEAAHRGDPHAQHLVGLAHADGYHLPFDRVQAVGWLSLAEAGLRGFHGHEEVASDHIELVNSLSDGERRATQTFQASYTPLADDRSPVFLPGEAFTRRMQAGLSRAGHAAGPVDGLMGDATHQAITTFLAEYGLATSQMNQLTVSIVAVVLQTYGHEAGEPSLVSLPHRAMLPPLVENGPAGAPVGVSELYSYGTGFFVAEDGLLVTNDHVINACREVRVEGRGPARVVVTDAATDLALLKIDGTAPAVARLREGLARQGEGVFAYGFPLRTLLSKSAVMTDGMVNALAGVSDDQDQMQISAAIQPGNSGGPLLDASGRVVGVVAARIRDEVVLAGAGAVPQNVNFAIKTPALYALLDRAGVAPTISTDAERRYAVDIADEARAYTVAIECWR